MGRHDCSVAVKKDRICFGQVHVSAFCEYIRVCVGGSPQYVLPPSDW